MNTNLINYAYYNIGYCNVALLIKCKVKFNITKNRTEFIFNRLMMFVHVLYLI